MWNSGVVQTDQCRTMLVIFSDNAHNKHVFLSRLPMPAWNIYHHFIGYHIIIWIQNLFFTSSLIRLLGLDYGGFADAKSLFTYNYENSASLPQPLSSLSLCALNLRYFLLICSSQSSFIRCLSSECLATSIHDTRNLAAAMARGHPSSELSLLRRQSHSSSKFPTHLRAGLGLCFENTVSVWEEIQPPGSPQLCHAVLPGVVAWVAGAPLPCPAPMLEVAGTMRWAPARRFLHAWEICHLRKIPSRNLPCIFCLCSARHDVGIGIKAGWKVCHNM